ncbi:MAG: hypothetical protein PF638_02780 [Candidatus Delongbacteria bacterium]|jgi:hypothetical protein|nr:hypothetical protein [Candidatus Delongbacteria bacterium]
MENKNSQNKQIYYKYRSLENFKHFTDIILNNRMYAALFSAFHDIDNAEGKYYHDGKLNPKLREKLIEEKKGYGICCLAENSENEYLWENYANKHKGIAIAIRLSENCVLREINYNDSLVTLTENDQIDYDTAINILTTKQEKWVKEQEIRAIKFRDGGNYFSIEIIEVIAGKKMSDDDYDLLEKLVQKIDNKITVKKKREMGIEDINV